MPQKQPKRRLLRFNDGSCVRLRPEHRNHVWSYDFVSERTSDGRSLRLLNIIDKYTKESLASRVERAMKANDVIDTLSDLFITHGTPQFIRSDNGPEFVAEILRTWLHNLGVITAFIEPVCQQAGLVVRGRTATSSHSTGR